MKFVPVKEDPRLMTRSTHRFTDRHDLLTLLQEFLASGVKYAKVEIKPGEYSDISSARSAFVGSVNSHKMPIEVVSRDSVLYLCRKVV